MRRLFLSRLRVSTSWSASSRSCISPIAWPPFEMWRALTPAGRLAIASWASIDHARGCQLLVDIAARRCGREAADVLAAPFVLGDQVELAELYVKSGVPGAKVTLHEGSIRFASVKEFIRVEGERLTPGGDGQRRCDANLASESNRPLRSSSYLRSRLSCRWMRTSRPQARPRSLVGVVVCSLRGRSKQMLWHDSLLGLVQACVKGPSRITARTRSTMSASGGNSTAHQVAPAAA